MRIYPVLLHVILVALGVTVLGLVRENQNLRDVQRPAEPGVKIGETMTALQVRELDGAAGQLKFAGSERETLVFVFTTTCGACKQNQERWRSLYQEMQDQYEFVGISLDDLNATSAYHDAYELPFRTVIAEPPGDFSQAYDIHLVPVTIHLDRGGRVRGSWLGVLTEDSMTQIKAISVARASR